MGMRISFGIILSGAAMLANAAPLSLTLPIESTPLGESRVVLERGLERLCAPPLDDIEFVLSDVGFQRTRRFTEYSGDVSGRMVSALNAVESVLHRENPMLKPLCARILEYQKADGHFGVDQNLAEKVDQARDMPILWGNGRMLLALAERCRRDPDPALLNAAKRLGDYILSTRPYYGLKENFEKVGGVMASGFTTCYPSMIDGLVSLAELTGDMRYADEARYIGQLSLLDTEFAGHHSHGRLVAYRGMLDLDRLQKTEEFLPAIQAGCKKYTDEMILPTGGVTEMSDRAYDRDEGCSEADWIRVNLLLWRATGDLAYLDAAEHALYNHLLAMQFANGGFGHGTFKPVQSGDVSWLAGRITHYVSDSYWCCSMHATQVLTDAAAYAALADGTAIDVTWLSETQNVLDFGGKKVTIRMERTAPAAWRVSVQCPSPVPTVLRLRMPGWSDRMLLNGQPQTPVNGWVEYPIAWTGSRTLKVEFSNAIRFAGPYQAAVQENAPVRVFAGPYLYCLPEAILDKAWGANPAAPVVLIAADAPDPYTHRIPALVQGEGGALQKARLEPFFGHTPGAARFLLNVQRVPADQFAEQAKNATPEVALGKKIECLLSCDKEYTVYLNGNLIFQGGGWSEAPRVTAYARPGVNVLAVKTPAGIATPGLIGQILAGGKILPTRLEGWSVIPCTEAPTAEQLTTAKVPDTALPIKDYGELGTPPWNHMPAQFASIGAHWIWPSDNTAGADRTHFLFIRTFQP